VAIISQNKVIFKFQNQRDQVCGLAYLFYKG